MGPDMPAVARIALGYLVALALLAWGYAIGKHNVFPASHIDEVSDFVAGGAIDADTTVAEKIANDLGIAPRRFVVRHPAQAIANTQSIAVPGLKPRRAKPSLYIHPDHRQGYRVLFGAFDFVDSFWGGVLIGPNGTVLHTWVLSTDHLPTSQVHEELKNLEGIQLFPDGSVIFLQQVRGGGIVRVDACSRVTWNLTGAFHHAISLDNDGSFWTYQGADSDFDQRFANVDSATGEIRRIIDMREVRARNPHIHLWNLQRIPNVAHANHGNDVEPLPASLANEFPGFSAGDLLISFNTPNLVFVLDPSNLQVKWWRVGAWDRPHDPDWEPGGQISVFSNNWISDRQFSDVVVIDPETLEFRLAVDGALLGFYTAFNGQQQLTPWGTRLVSSALQGWFFETDRAGEVVFSFVNTYDEPAGTALKVSEALRVKSREIIYSFSE